MNLTDQEMIDEMSHTQGNDIDENEITSGTDKSVMMNTCLMTHLMGHPPIKLKSFLIMLKLIWLIAIQNHQQHPTVLKMMLKKFLESLMILTLMEYNSGQTKFMLFRLKYSTGP